MFRKKVEERAAALYLLENPFFLKGEYEKVQFKKFEKLRKQLIIMYKGMVRDNFPQKIGLFPQEYCCGGNIGRTHATTIIRSWSF